LAGESFPKWSLGHLLAFMVEPLECHVRSGSTLEPALPLIGLDKIPSAQTPVTFSTRTLPVMSLCSPLPAFRDNVNSKDGHIPSVLSRQISSVTSIGDLRWF
jgi:hypothetical protein